MFRLQIIRVILRNLWINPFVVYSSYSTYSWFVPSLVAAQAALVSSVFNPCSIRG